MKAEIETKRLTLRCLDVDIDNLDSYLSWMRNIKLTPFISGVRADFTREDLISYVLEKNNSNNALLLGIFTKDSPRHIGNIKLEPLIIGQEGCIGILIGEEEMRGKSIGFEAIKALIQFSSSVYGLRNIYLGVDPKNLAAVQLYKKLGFTENFQGSRIQNGLEMNYQIPV